MDPSTRRIIAGRTLNILTRAPFDIIRFDLAADLDLYTDLVLENDVTVAVFGDIRIYRGATLIPTASGFILRAASARGDVVAVEAHPSGVSLSDHLQRI